MIAHRELLAKSKQGRIDVYFEGDSITRRLGATDYPDLKAGTNNVGEVMPVIDQVKRRTDYFTG